MPHQYSCRRNIHLYREWTADQLVALVKNPHVPKQEAWVTSIMRFLILHGFYRQRQMSQVRAAAKLCCRRVSGICIVRPNTPQPLHRYSKDGTRSQDSEAPAELTRAAPTPALMQATHDMCAQRAFSLLGELSSWSPALHGGVDNSDANGAMATKPHSHALDGMLCLTHAGGGGGINLHADLEIVLVVHMNGCAWYV